MIPITQAMFLSIVNELVHSETGDWVLLGGALVLAFIASTRAAYDIDLGRADTS